MSDKVTVTTTNRPPAGPNSRLRMGEGVIALIQIEETSNTSSTNPT